MADCISYKEIPYYSSLIIDYLDQKEELKSFYHRFPHLKNFKKQIEEKQSNFSKTHRNVLNNALQKQYKNLETTQKVQDNIEALKKENTFTITTGHQLNLFSGPLYYLYKIVSVINLTEELKKEYPKHNFVPIFWMASEDHDFEEINFFNYKDKRIQWNSKQSGAVGRFETHQFQEVFERFSAELNTSENADYLRDLFKEAYLNHANLTEATQFITNELFKDKGLVIIDGDDKYLKKLFIPQVKKELLNQITFKNVSNSAEELEKLDYKIQVNPREINLFYLRDGKRERLIKEDDNYYIHNTEVRFTEKEILEKVKNSPEKFSPNAIMRPLYQEVILPNLCYVGGSGELAYWLELKTYFKTAEITFPMLLLRNSVLLMTQKQQQKCKKLGIELTDLFGEQHQLIEKKTREVSEIVIDFTPQKQYLKKQFEDLYKLAKKTDNSFLGAVGAQERKQIKGLEHLEKRLLKAQKRKLADELNRVRILQDELFPEQNLQERVENFVRFYEEYGADLLSLLYKELKPLQLKFDVLTLT